MSFGNDIFTYLAKHWRNRQSKRFLFAMMILILIITFSVISWLSLGISSWGIPIRSLLPHINTPLWQIKLWSIIILELIWILTWLHWRDFPKFNKNKVWIYLIPYFSESKILEAFIENFKNDLEEKIWHIANVEAITSPYFYKKLSQLHKDAEEAIGPPNTKATENIKKIFKSMNRKFNVSYVILFECNERNNWITIKINKIKQLLFPNSNSHYNQLLLEKNFSISMPPHFDIKVNEEQEQIQDLLSQLWPYFSYIIAVTYFLKHDYSYCINLGEKCLHQIAKDWEIYSHIMSLLWQAIVDQSRLKLKEMYSTGIYKDFWDILSNIERVSQLRGSYSILLTRAMIYFLQDFETSRARKYIKKSQWHPWSWDQQWMINLLFLELWDNNVPRVLDGLKKIQWKRVNRTIWDDIEEFNNGIFKIHPDKINLYFWNAIMAIKIQKDVGKFNHYKKLFLENSPNNELSRYIEAHYSVIN